MPCFRKVHTDISYLACARKLLSAQDAVFPQFATHNAYTLAAIYQMGKGKNFEHQCLHGMGETLYDQVVGPQNLGRRVRVYAPVGTHETLLAYLVRRLLENGANTSFVNQIVDENISIDTLIRSPFETIAEQGIHLHPALPLPRNLYGEGRLNSKGIDLSNENVLQQLQEKLNESAAQSYRAASIINGEARAAQDEQPVKNPAGHNDVVGTVSFADAALAQEAVAAAEAAKARKRRTAIIVSLVVIALLLIGGSVWALTHGATTTETTPVPNVVGLTQAEAKSQIEAAGFTWELNPDKVASDTVEAGSVVSTDPAAGTTAEKGATVRVTISSGPDSVVVPDNLVGMDPDDARKAVEALGLKWEVSSTKVASDTVAEGKVAQTNPSPGSKVKAGQTITASLSSGSSEVEVPDLQGMSQDQARSALKAAGLELGNVTSVDSDKEKDRIVSQDPETGTKVKKGTTIAVSVSNGKSAQVKIPSIVGIGREDAEAQLKALGLNVTVEEVSGSQPAGQVLSVEPAEGSMVDKNSTVKIKVSKGSGGNPSPSPTKKN